jgi:hypothetical protein
VFVGEGPFQSALPDELTIALYAKAYLSVRPPFLLAARLPYDDLLRSLEKFAASLYMDVLTAQDLCLRGYAGIQKIATTPSFDFIGRSRLDGYINVVKSELGPLIGKEGSQEFKHPIRIRL